MLVDCGHLPTVTVEVENLYMLSGIREDYTVNNFKQTGVSCCRLGRDKSTAGRDSWVENVAQSMLLHAV